MSRVLVIGNDNQVSRQIGDALTAADVPMEYAAGNADALQRLRMRSFGVVVTSPDSAVEEDLALLEEMRGHPARVEVHRAGAEKYTGRGDLRDAGAGVCVFHTAVRYAPYRASGLRCVFGQPMAGRYPTHLGKAGLGGDAALLPADYSGAPDDLCEGAEYSAV